MKKLAIQINEIENGFLVMLPGIQTSNQTMQEPKTFFCEDYAGVVIALNDIWPNYVRGVKIVRP